MIGSLAPRSCRPVALLLALGATSVSACGGGGEESAGVTAEWRAERDTVGDTVVVRTVAGSVWGDTARLVEELRIGRREGPPEETFGDIRGLEVGSGGSIYVADRQVPVLREYGRDGGYRRTLGGEGSGPGEYAGFNASNIVATLPDGRVLLRDPGNARIHVYGPEGEFRESWRIRGGQFTSTPLFTDTAGHVHQPVFEFEESGTTWRLVEFGPDGARLDTLPVDHWSHDPPMLEAVYEGESGRGMSRRPVPFSPQAVWTFSPLGYLVGGVTGEYRFDLLRPNGPVVRIERRAEPVPVRPGEKENHRARIVASMRNTDPNWRWDGPAIPDVKSPIRNLMVDDDGRIWVRRSTRAVPVPEEEVEEPEDPSAPPPDRWREPLVFDVFAPDGRYLGPVRPPEEFSLSTRPVIRGDTVWAVAEDELGVDYVVRYRLEVGTGG